MRASLIILFPAYATALRGPVLLHEQLHSDDVVDTIMMATDDRDNYPSDGGGSHKKNNGLIKEVEDSMSSLVRGLAGFLEELQQNQIGVQEAKRRLQISRSELNSCFYKGDGCSCKGSLESGSITWECPDVCGQGHTFSGSMVVSSYSYSRGHSHNVPTNHQSCVVTGCGKMDKYLDCAGFGVDWTCDSVCGDSTESSEVETTPPSLSPTSVIAAEMNSTRTTSSAETISIGSDTGSTSIGGVVAIVSIILALVCGASSWAYCHDRSGRSSLRQGHNVAHDAECNDYAAATEDNTKGGAAVARAEKSANEEVAAVLDQA